VPAFVNLVVINKFVIRSPRPTSRGLIVLAGKDAHSSWDRDVGRVIKIEVKFPIETSRRNRRVRQPVECEVVEYIVSCQVTCGVSINRAPEYCRSDRCRGLAITVTVVKEPSCQADGRIRQSVQRLRARPIICA
jgi:hypothetical protein